MVKMLELDAPLATVFGGSGFIGRYVVRRLVSRGWRVRVAVRNPNSALFLKTYGEVGQVELKRCSIFDKRSVASSLAGSNAVINAVAGRLSETSRKKIAKFYYKGPEIIATECKKAKIESFIHISAIGADDQTESLYSKYKRRGEKTILKLIPSSIILRPSLVFGNEDQFFNRYASMSAYSLFIPVIGENTCFQPIYVDDLAAAVEKAVVENITKGIFEIGGPDVFSHRELIQKTLKVVRRRRIILPIPAWLAAIMATAFGYIETVSFGIVRPPFSIDNLKQLKLDNVVTSGTKSVKDLKIQPKSVDSIIPSYLYSFRPYGQYNEITEISKRSR